MIERWGRGYGKAVVCVSAGLAFLLNYDLASDAVLLMIFILSYSGCTYIAPNGTLHATFEAKLGNPYSGCIIC